MSEENNELKSGTEDDYTEGSIVESEPSAPEAVEEDSDENETILSSSERVPNSKRGLDHKHAYVMLGLIVVFLIFSFIVSNFTMSY